MKPNKNRAAYGSIVATSIGFPGSASGEIIAGGRTLETAR
jgi:hypothetical protein